LKNLPIHKIQAVQFYFLKHFYIVLFLFFSIIAYSQGELGDDKGVFYRNERTWGLSLNTNGYSLNYRYGKRVNFTQKTLFEADISVIKHNKEIKLYPELNYRSFVFGKLNSVYFIRAGYGRQVEWFPKTDKGSISIRYFYTGGISLSILKPIYYVVLYPFDTLLLSQRFEDINPSRGQLLGGASSLKGWGELAFMPGAYIRSGLTFEFSDDENRISALEIALTLDAFPKKIKQMENERNNFAFLSMNVTYRFGKVLDARMAKTIDSPVF